MNRQNVELIQRPSAPYVNIRIIVLKSMRTLSTAVLVALLLNACGLKGPLYLPQEPAPEKPPAAQPQKSPDTEKKK